MFFGLFLILYFKIQLVPQTKQDTMLCLKFCWVTKDWNKLNFVLMLCKCSTKVTVMTLCPDLNISTLKSGVLNLKSL